MPELTVAEEAVLIALDERSGGGRARLGVDWAVAGAVIVELALGRRISVGDDDYVTVVDHTPTGAAHVDATLHLVAADGGMKVGKLLRRTRRRALGDTIASLVDREVLAGTRGRFLGVIPVRRYPARDHQAEVAIRERLVATVLDGRPPDERTAALIGVLSAGKLWRKAVPVGSRRQVKRRMSEIADSQSVPPAVRKALVRTRAAIIAMASNSG